MLAVLLMAMASSVGTWVEYHSNEMAIHYYDLGSAEPSTDGTTGTVRYRIIYSSMAREFEKSIFGSRSRGVASSTGLLIFRCLGHTYRPLRTQDWDEIGNAIPLPQTTIELTVPDMKVDPQIEPAFKAACPT